MEYIDLGSISVFINISEKQNKLLNDSLIQAVENTVRSEFKKDLATYHPDLKFIVSVDSRRGCLIETVSIGPILTAGYKFIKDYDKIRNNLKLICEDLKNVYLKVTGKTKSNSFEVDEVEIIKDRTIKNSNTKTLIEKRTKKERITISNHLITIMREDIKEKISKTDMKKLDKKKKK